jgi:NDP-sugar pyrophosphorylase family protein
MKPILVALAAGMGSRYGGVKQIDSVGLHNETLLDFATYDAKQCGYEKVIYIIRKDIEADFRERVFDRVSRNMDAGYVFQVSDRAKPWGTIHALLAAKDVVNVPFTVINADDYYGRSAFRTLNSYLSGLAIDSAEHAMVGYVLEHTMSKSGSVSRGVCSVKDGALLSLREHTRISYTGEGKIVTELEGETKPLTGKEWVSMNFFGFTPQVFDFFQTYWENFYLENRNSAKAECLLPNAVNAIAARNMGSVRFFSSEESWFGMTYPEDRALVKAEIAQKISNGYYPERLWEK